MTLRGTAKQWALDWFWPRLRQTLKAWNQDDGGRLAASTAYYAAFSFFPLLLTLIVVFGFVLRFSPGARSSEQELLKVIGQSAPALSNQVSQVLNDVKTRAAVNAPVSLMALLFSVIGLFYQVETAFDRIWGREDEEKRGLWGALRNALWDRLHAFLMFMALGGLMVGFFVAGLAISAVEQFARQIPGGNFGWNVFELVVTVSLNTFVLAAIYKVQPKTPMCWKDVWLGAFLAAFVWEIGRQILAAFVIGEKYSAYGIVGSFIGVMVWIYYASTVLYLGAEFIQVSCQIRNEQAETA